MTSERDDVAASTSARSSWRSLTDCETVGIPALMSRKTLGILDGGRGGGVDRSWRRVGVLRNFF